MEVVIGTGESVIQWLLMPRLDRIREQLPSVRLRFLNLPTAEAVKRLADGVIDFALVRKDAVARPLQARSLGVMDYSLFIPATLQTRAGRKDGLKLLDGLPLATLEGEGDFRSDLARVAKRAGVKLNVQVECSSFPLAARAVAKGNVTAILPTIATTDLAETTVVRMVAPFLECFDREMSLAWNSRLLRIRPILSHAATVLERVCRF